MDLRVLFVEDSPDDLELMVRRLREAGIQLEWQRVDTEDALRLALRAPWDLALVDYNLPGFGGIKALRVLAQAAPDVPAITVSGAISEDTAVATITAGAVDYVLKDNLTRLAPAAQRAVEGAELRCRQREAAEQARRTQFAIDHSSQTIAYVSRDGTILYANAAAERLSGVAGDHLLGRNIHEWAPQSDEWRWAELWEAAVEHPPVQLETTIRSATGRELLVALTLDYPGAGGSEFVVVYARDITERRTAQEALRKSEAQLRTLVDTLPDLVWLKDPDGIYLSCNQRFASFIGAAEQDIVGKSDYDFLDDGLADSFREHDARAVAANGPTVNEEEIVFAEDGHREILETIKTPVYADDGALIGVLGVGRDVTERKRVEEELRFTRFVVEQAGDAVFWMTADGAFKYANPTTCATLGYSLDELRHMTIHEIDPAYPAERWPDHMEELRQAGSLTFETLHRSKSGTLIPMEIMANYLEFGGYVYDVAFARDIGERKRADEALRQSEDRFRRVSAATSDFAYSCIKEADGAYHFDWLTGAVERITGWSRDDLMDWGCWKRLVLDEDLPLFEAKVVGLAPGASSVCELRIRDRQGGVRWLAAYSEAEVGADDSTFRRLHGACQDITERRVAEEELERSHDLLSNLTRLVPGVVYQYRLYPDGSSAFPYSSPGLNDIYECTPEEVREDATPVFGRLHPDDAERVGDLIQESARTLEEFYCEFRVVLPRQGLRWRWSQAHPERTEDGGTLWHGIISDITDRKLADEQVLRQAAQLKRTVEGAVLAMSHMVESRDPYTAGHERRVSELATALGAHLGMAGEELTALRLAGLIHDIGKIAVPAEILAKPGRLSEVEFNLIRQHPQSGFEILGAIDFGGPVAEMVLQHHERLDGSGYPRALAGQDVLPEARILAVADVVEAMSSHRPYRAALGMDAALAEVREHAGEKYDPEVVAACVRLFEEQGFAFTE